MTALIGLNENKEEEVFYGFVKKEKFEQKKENSEKTSKEKENVIYICSVAATCVQWCMAMEM